MRKVAWPLPALAMLGCGGPPAEEHVPAGPVLPWVADDYPAALAAARARKLPLFVESWAPW